MNEINFKNEYQELLDIFKFIYRCGDLNTFNYEDVYFVKSEKECYHNLRFARWRNNINDEYIQQFILYTNYRQGTNKSDIHEDCVTFSELKEILKRRFPEDWKKWKRKNIKSLF